MPVRVTTLWVPDELWSSSSRTAPALETRVKAAWVANVLGVVGQMSRWYMIAKALSAAAPSAAKHSTVIAAVVVVVAQSNSRQRTLPLPSAVTWAVPREPSLLTGLARPAKSTR